MVNLAQLGPAIDVRKQFAAERAGLLELLKDVSGDAWTTATICPGRAVADVVAHLLHDTCAASVTPGTGITASRGQRAAPR